MTPPHYDHGPYEPLKVADAWDLSRRLTLALKYVCRRGRKDGADELTDLRKAKHCIELEIARIELQKQV